MKWLSGGLTLVNVATVCALLLGIVWAGLNQTLAIISLSVGLVAAVWAFFQTRAEREWPAESRTPNRSRVWFWILAGCFAFFAFRSFCWLIFLDGNQWKVQSPNNLGDLAIHLTYINSFANGVPLWPDNPIHPFSKMRYPAGTDLFNALLVLLDLDIHRGLIWAGLLGSFAGFYSLYRWGGAFGIAAFLFNGGLAGFQLLQTGKFLDYQGDSAIAWKSLPLAMFVTQRGLLYAMPVGLLLLYQWRAKYLARDDAVAGVADPGSAATHQAHRDHRSRLQPRSRSQPPLPFWVELMLYATMPLFHMHTFIALSGVAAVVFLFGDKRTRLGLGLLVGAAVIPATALVWCVTDYFRARSLLEWAPGWVRGTSEFTQDFFEFWLVNFGITIPLIMLLLGGIGYKIWKASAADQAPAVASQPQRSIRADLARLWPALRTSAAFNFTIAGVLLFLFACLVKAAPWEWDNIKLIIWAYLLILPFLWTELIAKWSMPVRVGICIALFGSGFVSLFGGLVAGENGHGLIERAELDAVGQAVRKLPVEERFVTHPTYNHPVLLHGRNVVFGYPGHLWTQGFDYDADYKKLTALLQGAPNWREHARHFRARYLFWGREEKAHYASSTRPWEREAQLIASGTWGAIYDLEASPAAVRPGQ